MAEFNEMFPNLVMIGRPNIFQNEPVKSFLKQAYLSGMERVVDALDNVHCDDMLEQAEEALESARRECE